MTFVLCTLVAGSLFAGCGIVADPERRVIATVGEREITRRDFNRILREMPLSERPWIASHQDMVDAVQAYIDREVLLREAVRLEAQGQIAVPDQAAEQNYFENNPEIVDVRLVTDPGVLAVDEDGLAMMQEAIEQGIEAARRDLLAEQALAFLVARAAGSGEIVITEADFEAAYRAHRDELLDFERIWVRGLLFPVLPENDGVVQQVAGDARRQLDAGADLDAVIEQHLIDPDAPIHDVRRMGLPLETDIPNDPRLPQYRGLWDDVGTAEPGDIIGPLSVQPTTRFVPGPDGRPVREAVPPSIMLVELLRHQEARPLSLAESRERLQPGILEAKVMERLRAEYNARVIEDNLPSPASYGAQGTIMRE